MHISILDKKSISALSSSPSSSLSSFAVDILSPMGDAKMMSLWKKSANSLSFTPDPLDVTEGPFFALIFFLSTLGVREIPILKSSSSLASSPNNSFHSRPFCFMTESSLALSSSSSSSLPFCRLIGPYSASNLSSISKIAESPSNSIIFLTNAQQVPRVGNNTRTLGRVYPWSRH